MSKLRVINRVILIWRIAGGSVVLGSRWSARARARDDAHSATAALEAYDN